MKVQEKLKEYYAKSPFGDDGGASDEEARVYAGPYMITVKNSPERREVIPYHDLHHLVSGYNNSRIGEGEAGAWELGTNCWNKPVTVLLNLGGMVAGIPHSPRRVYLAFMAGCKCRNLYDLPIQQILESDYSEIYNYVHQKNKEKNWFVNNMRFSTYFFAACAIIPVATISGFIFNFFQKSNA